jgi:hypothetical protein
MAESWLNVRERRGETGKNLHCEISQLIASTEKQAARVYGVQDYKLPGAAFLPLYFQRL